MKKIPSFDAIATRAALGFKRFPFTILCSASAACMAMYLIEDKARDPKLSIINLMLCMALGIPLFFSVGVVAERKEFDNKIRGLFYFAGAALLALIYWSLPTDNSVSNIAIPYIRYTIFNIVFHLLASFAAYLRPYNYNGFWQYNKALFLRFLESVLYSGFLYAGLALAMGALDVLFDANIPENLYSHLFLFLMGFFNTWFFVSGVPQNFDELETSKTYPKGLKIFTQYVLLPLLIIYLIILYSYGLKIIMTGIWPEGLVSYLIICVAVVGIFLVLLLYPYQKIASNNWVKRFSYFYYVALVPLVMMLFVAIGMRMDNYGITINRYIITLLGIWLSIVCTYYLIGKKNIKFIPISLSLILLACSFGPWSIFSVSENSQMNRLDNILIKKNLINEGKIKNQSVWKLNEHNELVRNDEVLKNNGLLSDSLHQEMRSILNYLDKYHDLSALSTYLDQNIDSLIAKSRDSVRYINRTKIYMESMGLPYYQRSKRKIRFYTYSCRIKNATKVEGYDYLAYVNDHDNDPNNRIKSTFKMDTVSFSVELHKKVLNVTSERDTFKIDLTSIIGKLEGEYGKGNANSIPNEKMMLLVESQNYDVKLFISTMSFDNKGIKPFLNYINGRLLLREK